MSYQLGYLEHLTEQDLELLGEGSDLEAGRLRDLLRDDPGQFDRLVAAPALFGMVFEDPDPELRVRLSPFLVFAILVNRVLQDLETTSYTYEWAGRNLRLPVFDTDSMRDFLDDPAKKMFLAEFLSSFTRITSGTVRVRTRRGYRRQRFSELDPVRMAEMVDGLPPVQRPGGYRRLGDIALFLTGVFPDHTAGRRFSPVQRERLVRSAGIDTEIALTVESDLDFLERLGSAWYQRAVESAVALVGVGPATVEKVAESFRPARRILNYLADTYLHHYEGGLSRPA